MTHLEARNLEVKRGGTTHPQCSILRIQEGEILSLIGPNGAGKTTLLQTLSYLLKPFEGEIFFRGERVNSNHSIFNYRRKLAMVFQEPLLFDTTVFDNVASGLRIRGMKKAEIRKHREGATGPIRNRSPQSALRENAFRRRGTEDESCPGLFHSTRSSSP